MIALLTSSWILNRAARFLDHSALVIDLQELLGYKVDVVTEGGLY